MSLATLLLLAVSLAPPGLASAPFAQLPTQGVAAGIRWTWPDAGAFSDVLARPVRPYAVMAGPLTVVARKGIGRRVQRGIAAGKGADQLAWLQKQQPEVPFGVLTWSTRGGPAILDNLEWGSRLAEGTPEEARVGDRLVLIWPEVVVAGPAPAAEGDGNPDTLLAWAYATTLLVSEPPVYDEEVDRDWSNQEKLAALKADGKKAEMVAVYRRYRPMGRCSMDTAPAQTARDYADLCYELGQIGCFLQLQVRIMGDRFERVAASSYGERAASTGSAALIAAGVDARRFLLGLLLQYDVEGLRPREEMGPWRLARSMAESGLDFGPDLLALATDAHLDAANRLRASTVLWLLWRRAEELPATTLVERLKGQPLLPMARAWMQAVEAKIDPNAPETLTLFE
ncbi:MAG: hypothetical protein H6706_09320 [Myxococcales bacterium]|nr:hypothetical protein [Myxococcales bacterium]